MAESVNFYDINRAFWKENAYEPFPASATAMFFFLLNLANGRYWKMPVQCATTTLMYALKLSKQTVLDSRSLLRTRGLIRFSKGTGKGNPPLYIVETDPSRWKERSADNTHITLKSTDRLTESKTLGQTEGKTDNQTVGPTLFNIEDKKIKKSDTSINKKGDGKILKIDELEEIFLSDADWLETLVKSFSEMTQVDMKGMKEYVRDFFLSLRGRGMNEREEKECRTHCFNWIRQKITNQKKQKTNDDNRQNQIDRRRGAGITAVSPREYEGAF